MKNVFSAIWIIALLACDNQAPNTIGNTVTANSAAQAPRSPDGDCGASLLFRKGVVIHSSSYDAMGKETTKSVSTNTKVSQQGGMTISEWEMKNTKENIPAGEKEGADGKIIKATYKCDGKLLHIDLSGLLPDNQQNTKIESSGLQFPLHITVGETLPEAQHSIKMNSAGREMKITSHIKERKVEAKESVTTPAGTFECYRISSVVEADTDMPGMDEQSKKIMAEVKKKMGKNRMICWYVPDVTIIKMEFHMGNKLISRTEITAIKK
jgi:hypothetical protein